MRFFSQPGLHEECWYYQVTIPEAGLSGWFSHCLSTLAAAPALLEALIFRETHPPVYLSEAFSLDRVRHSSRYFFLQTGRSWLRSQGALGYLQEGQHSLHWDLDFEPQPASSPVYALQESRQGALWMPQPHLLCSGRICLDGKEFRLDQEPGMQGHRWSRQPWLPRFWSHCNTFLEDETASLEVLVPSGWRRPWVCLVWRGESFVFQGYPWQFAWHAGVSAEQLVFTSRQQGLGLRAVWTVAAEQYRQLNSAVGRRQALYLSTWANLQLEIRSQTAVAPQQAAQVLSAFQSCTVIRSR